MGMIEINWKPDRRMLRHFGLIGLCFCGAIGGYLAYRDGWTPWSIGLASAAVLFGMTALAAPAALKYVFIGLSVVTAPIGYVVSHVILGVLYFGLFTPVRLVQTIIGRDALARRFDRQAPTYWTVRRRRADSASYFRQF
jgi:hypothetical protein